ncbi:MAG: lipopolysaccharide heptosyltransferase II, partial [Gammaproteobacteria bacterium]|nr:lipopolysaccharide heptosyltransferase II [Gammaproteobacteria bacterium]
MGNLNSNSGKRILVVGPSWVGDMVMAQSLFKLLRHQQPSAHITVMAPAWSQALINRMPEIDVGIESPFDHGDLKLVERWRFGRQLSERFDTAYVLPNSFKSALVTYFARIPARIGWQGEYRNMLLTDCRKLDPSQYPLMVERFMALALDRSAKLPAIDRPALLTDSETATTVAASLGVARTERALALCPGAEFGDAKQWPLEHYAKLCDLAVESGWQVWILGSPNDQEAGEQVVLAVSEPNRASCFDLTGKTNLDQAIDLL